MSELSFPPTRDDNVAALRSWWYKRSRMLRPLNALINECLAKKQGNKEFALFHLDDGCWRAEIGNPSLHVMLGESSGEFSAKGQTAEEAVARLIDVLPTNGR